MNVTVCPSTLSSGYNSYSPKAVKELFAEVSTSHDLLMPSPGSGKMAGIVPDSIGRISLFGVQSKMSMVMDKETKRLRYAVNGEQGVFIAKPVPMSYRLYDKEDRP